MIRETQPGEIKITNSTDPFAQRGKEEGRHVHFTSLPDSERADETDVITDVKWKEVSILPNLSWTNDISLDPLDYTLHQRNFIRICVAYIFSWFAEWSSFIWYVIADYTFTNWLGEGQSLGFHIIKSVLIAFQIMFYCARLVTLIIFFVMCCITLYICITNRKAFRFYNQTPRK